MLWLADEPKVRTGSRGLSELGELLMGELLKLLADRESAAAAEAAAAEAAVPAFEAASRAVPSAACVRGCRNLE